MLVQRSSLAGQKQCFVAPSRKVTACAANNKPKSGGYRYDGSMLRWVRDDRLTNDTTDTTVRPLTGPEYTVWPVVYNTLVNAGLQSVTAEEAFKLSQSGWTLVDVRVDSDFEVYHAAGAVNIPLFRGVQGNTFWDNVKKGVMAGFAMKATERDPDFIQKSLTVLKKNQRIVVMCAVGGTLDTNVSYRREKKLYADPDRAFGRESRSLRACYEFLQGGWNKSNVRFIDGGVQQWRYQGFPMAD